MYLLGDSTTRQWAFELSVLLNYKLSAYYQTTHPSWMFQFNHYFDQIQFNVTFQFHPQILGSATIPVDDEMYEVDVLDSLTNEDCNYVVVISPWAHFSQWWKYAYTERLRLLRSSVERLKSRCPDVPVILKSPHVRNHKDKYSHLMNGDYIISQIKRDIETVFKDVDVFYVNVWDMNLAYPGTKTIHMPMSVVNQELSILLSYLCQDRG